MIPSRALKRAASLEESITGSLEEDDPGRTKQQRTVSPGSHCAETDACTRFGQQWLGKATHLWMTRDHTSKWATVPVDAVDSIVVCEFRQTAKVIEDLNSRFQPQRQTAP